MAPGTAAEVYLLAAPERKFRAKVQGISWAVKPEGEIDLPHSVPYVKRELNWVISPSVFQCDWKWNLPTRRSSAWALPRSPSSRVAIPGKHAHGGDSGLVRTVFRGWLAWLRGELAPFPGRLATTIRLMVTVVLVTIVSMTLEVPEVALSAYLVLFVTKENRALTTLVEG